MKYTLTLILLLLLYTQSNAQKDTTILYLDSSFRTTARSKAVFGKVIVHKDKMYLVAMVNMADGSKVFTGSYIDKQLTVSEGLFSFYTNDVLTMRGIYHLNRQVGVWKKWGIDSLLTDSVAFDESGFVKAKRKYSYHVNRTLWRTVFENDENQKVSREYDTLGNLVSEGSFTENEGETFFYYPDGKVRMHAVFKKGERVVYDFFDEEGKKYTEKEFVEFKKSQKPK